MYILAGERRRNFKNELIIAIEDDRKEIYEKYENYETLELKVKFELNEHILKLLKKVIKNDRLINEDLDAVKMKIL